MNDVRTSLTAALPGADLITDPDVLAALSHDEAEWAAVEAPAAALRARSTDEVRAAVAACADLRVPVVPRGAGTGLSGGANAVDGCLVLDLSRMNRIVDIDTDNLTAVVHAAAAAANGHRHPANPATREIPARTVRAAQAMKRSASGRPLRGSPGIPVGGTGHGIGS